MRSFYIAFICLLCSLSAYAQGQHQHAQVYFRGFYKGYNVFVRNPYIPEEKRFCTQKVYVNNKLMRTNPNTSAFEVDLSNLALNERVVIRIEYRNDQCKPQIINPQVLEASDVFKFEQVNIDMNAISWATKAETPKGQFLVEQEQYGQWEPIDTVQGKGDLFYNQYSVSAPHYPGENRYRLTYYPEGGNPINTDDLSYYSEKSPVEYKYDEKHQQIFFSEDVDYKIENASQQVVMKGSKSILINIQQLPAGIYYLLFNNRKEEILKNR